MNSTVKKMDFVSEVVRAVISVTGTEPVALHEPSFSGNEWKYLRDCLDSNYVSSVGPFVSQFESNLAEYTGAKYAISVVNGTSALHMALKLAGVQPGDEVLVPALTFIATANAVSYCGATPHFVDSDERTLGLNSEKLRKYLDSIVIRQSNQSVNKITGSVIRAMVPMHTFGHPSDLDGLMAISEEFNLVLVEDAAESLGSSYDGQHTGTFGLLGAISFNGNKIITTGGGGAILTNDESLAKRAKHLTTTAKKEHRWDYEHNEIGYNYRMPNINAALGCAQLEQLPQKLRLKRDLYFKYAEAFSNVEGMRLVKEPPKGQSNYWLNAILLNEEKIAYRDSILEECNNVGVSTRPSWKLLNNQASYNTAPRMDLSVAESLHCRLINLPSSPNILE